MKLKVSNCWKLCNRMKQALVGRKFNLCQSRSAVGTAAGSGALKTLIVMESITCAGRQRLQAEHGVSRQALEAQSG